MLLELRGLKAAFLRSQGVGDGVIELRIDSGPGYRIYFGIHEDKIILLLLGGDKGSQESDIKKAKEYWAEFKIRPETK